MSDGMDGTVPAAPDQAADYFGTRLPVAARYAGLLAGPGIERGLIGPREVPRLWERHLLNCAVVQDVIPQGSVVADVGSGAGLPGVVLAIVRPDITVTLIEPLLRRTTFLDEAVGELGLTNVTVLRARAEEVTGSLDADVVVARAVAPIVKLARWCVPLLRPGGIVAAMKGSTVEEELTRAARELAKLNVEVDVRTCGEGVLDPPTRVAVLRRIAPTTQGRGS